MQRARHFYAILALESFFCDFPEIRRRFVSVRKSPRQKIALRVQNSGTRSLGERMNRKMHGRYRQALGPIQAHEDSTSLQKLSSTRSFSLFTALTIRERCVRGSSPGYNHAPLCYFRRSHDRSIRSHCAILIQLNRAKYKLH